MSNSEVCFKKRNFTDSAYKQFGVCFLGCHFTLMTHDPFSDVPVFH